MTPRTSARRLRKPLIFGATIALGLGATGAAWAYMNRGHEDVGLSCRLHENSVTVINPVSGDPVADCAPLFAAEGLPITDLVAFEHGRGGIAVVPRARLPRDATPLPAQGAQDVRVIELTKATRNVLKGPQATCMNDAMATSLAHAHLRAVGLRDWSVKVHGKRPCAALTVSVDDRTVYVNFHPKQQPDPHHTDPTGPDGGPPPAIGAPLGSYAPGRAIAAEVAQRIDATCLNRADALAIMKKVVARHDPESASSAYEYSSVAAGGTCARAYVEPGGRMNVLVYGPDVVARRQK